MKVRKTVKIGAGLAAVSLIATGCLNSSNKTSGTTGANTNTSKTISMSFAFTGTQATAFEDALKPYASSQGITIQFKPDASFNTDIVQKVQANQLPDIALFPQPGILKQIAAQGKLADLDKILNIPALQKNLVSGLTTAGSLNGKVYGIPPSINVKSLVFYDKQAWAKAGYKIPTTLDQLTALTNQIRSQGKTPWCLGIGADTATGWPATDWIENLVLDYGGIKQYNDWISHKLKFDSPLVNKAADYFHSVFATPGNVDGGQKSIAGDNFGTAGNPLFTSTPGCYMFKQGNFIASQGFFPTSVLKNADKEIGVFYFPSTTASSKPVEGGGDIAALFSGKNASAVKIMKYMLTPQFCSGCPKQFSYESPFKNYRLSNYPTKLDQQMASIAYNATTFAFDASDQMPGAVGSGSFWKQMTAWVNGTTSQSDALKAIDSSWPTS